MQIVAPLLKWIYIVECRYVYIGTCPLMMTDCLMLEGTSKTTALAQFADMLHFGRAIKVACNTNVQSSCNPSMDPFPSRAAEKIKAIRMGTESGNTMSWLGSCAGCWVVELLVYPFDYRTTTTMMMMMMRGQLDKKAIKSDLNVVKCFHAPCSGPGIKGKVLVRAKLMPHFHLHIHFIKF